MTIDPETSRGDPPDGGRKRRHGVTLLVVLGLVAVGVVLLILSGALDGIDDSVVESKLPPDPTIMQDQQAPAITSPSDLPRSGGLIPPEETGSPVNGGMAPRPADTAAPVGPAPVPAE